MERIIIITDKQLWSLLESISIKDAEKAVKLLNRRIAEDKKDKIDMPITDLELSVKTVNALKAANINTLQDILKHEIEDILRLKNIGLKSITEIENALAKVVPTA